MSGEAIFQAASLLAALAIAVLALRNSEAWRKRNRRDDDESH
ncbi:MAG TPA: hypothetical protein VF559_03980 [Caulobacteraceae bacterium]|jgi:ABC-type sulfate transport system permease subunit